MTIALVQAPTYNSASANNVTTSYPNTPTNGNLLVAYTKHVGSASDGAITGWTPAVTAWQNPDSSYRRIGIFYKIAGAGESKNINYAMSGATLCTLAVEEWSGATTLDQVSHVDDPGGAGIVTSRSSGTTPTTTQANELIIALVGMSNTITSPSWSNSFTGDLAVITGSDLPALSAYKIVAAKAAYESTLSWTTAQHAGGCIATFYSPQPTNWGMLLSGSINRLVVGE